MKIKKDEMAAGFATNEQPDRAPSGAPEGASEGVPDIKTSQVKVSGIDEVASQIEARRYTLVSDEMPWNGGQERGPSPLEYALTGLGA